MNTMDELPTDLSMERLMENVQTAQRMGLVEGIREATAGHEIDAEGQPVGLDLLRDLIHETMGRGARREDLLLLLHPAQWYILRDDLELLRHWGGEASLPDGLTSFHGIPVLRDAGLPKAVVYLVDPDAITVGGTVVYPQRVGRLTGLMHPEEYQEVTR